MAEIYKNAVQVLIWIGTQADGSGEAIDAINSGIISVNKHWQQVEALFQQPYWNRVWIL